MTALVQLLQPLGVDLFCLGKKFLVFNIVSRNLKIKYRRSVFGVLWTLLAPLAMAVIYYFVFKIVLNIKLPNYQVFILSGVLPWAFFSQSILEGMESIVQNWSLVSKIPIPLQVFPWSCSVTNWVTLLMSLPILLGVAWLSGVGFHPAQAFILVYFLALFLISYGISLILAVGFVYLRDLRHLTGILIQIWF